MDPIKLQELIIGSKEIAKMRGGEKGAVIEEQPTMDFAFATVVTIKSVKAGELFTKDNIWVKRPGTGVFPAEKLIKILGKVALRDIESDVHLGWQDLDSLET